MDGSIQCLKHKSDLRMTVESRGRKTPTKVWTMQALNDGSLVTGNSLGQIQIFDTLTGTLVQSINQTELKADVLRVAVNATQTKIFASGVDSRVVCLERSSNSANASLGPGMIWKFTTAQRPHTHDVKCMAIVQGKATSDGTLKEALVTGGVDTKLCTYLVSDFAKKRPQVYYPWPSQSPVSTTSSCIGEDIGSRRILSIHRHNQIELYRLEDGLQDTKLPIKDTTRSTSELIGEIALETQSNLGFSALCPAGRWLAAANATKLFLFRLNWERKVMSTEDGGHEAEMDVDLQPDKVDLPEGLDKLTVTAIYFGSSNILYIADSRRRLFVVDLSKDEAKTVSTLQIPNLGEDWTLPICSIKASADNSFVAILTKTDKDGGIHVFRRLQGGNNGYAHYWALPGLTGARPAAVTFVGSSQLAVATVSFQIFVFDLESRKLSPWSEENKFPIEKWPTEISHRKDFPVRLFSNPKDHSQLIMVRFFLKPRLPWTFT
jgi:U3 small nucleolar RNA-associated protein 4